MDFKREYETASSKGSFFWENIEKAKVNCNSIIADEKTRSKYISTYDVFEKAQTDIAAGETLREEKRQKSSNISESSGSIQSLYNIKSFNKRIKKSKKLAKKQGKKSLKKIKKMLRRSKRRSKN